MSIYDDAVKVDSKCFFTYEFKDSQRDGTGFYKDPFEEQGRQSRTLLQKGTVVFVHKELKEMVKEIKKEAKYKFKESSLSDESKKVFKKERILSKIKK